MLLNQVKMGDELRDLVNRCLKLHPHCPFLISCEPKRMSQESIEAKSHPFAVNCNYLTREFRKVRDSIGAYADLPAEERPHFHQIRGLAIHLLTESGYDDEYIGALSGHADKRMLDRYRKDHEQRVPRLVESGLSLKGLGLE